MRFNVYVKVTSTSPPKTLWSVPNNQSLSRIDSSIIYLLPCRLHLHLLALIVLLSPLPLA